MSARLAALAALLTLTAGCSDYPEYDQFERACAERHGFVAQTGTMWSPRVDCIVDNRVIYLPGFA